MWLLLFWKKRKFLLFILIGIVSLSVLFLSVFLFMTAMFNQNRLAYFLLKQRADKAVEDIKREIGDRYNSDPRSRYREIENIEDGDRGNGINLLLIDRIATEGYVKELLQLYRDSADGKLFDSAYSLTFEGLLGMHKNESGFYPNTSGVLLKSYLPIDNGKVKWKEPINGDDGSGMTLKTFTSQVAGKVGIDTYYNGLRRRGAPYTGPFQININYFDSSFRSKLSGKGHSSNSRNSDPMYLPDSLAYMNLHYSKMVKSLGLEGKDRKILDGLYSAYHNGGIGHLSYTMSFGVGYDTKRLILEHQNANGKSNSEVKSEYSKHVAEIATILLEGITKYGRKIKGLDPSASAAIILLDNGYYLSETAYNGYACRFNGNRSVCGNDNGWDRSDAMVKAWEVLKGEKLSKQEMSQVLLRYKKTFSEAYPDYISSSDLNRIYGKSNSMDSDPKGAIWKLSNDTSFVYKNKINGQDPRVLHMTNMEVIGHMWDTMGSGIFVYENLLKLMGINEDPTNPYDYINRIKNEYIPRSTSFDAILYKMGVTDIDPKARDMLKAGYEISGFWYYLGGQGLPVSEANWSTHLAWSDKSSPTAYAVAGEKSRQAFEIIYETKDGTSPFKRENIRDSNLVNLGRILLDCSQLVYQAYNRSIAKITGKPLDAKTSAEQLKSSFLVTIQNWDEAKPGDIFVKNGHVFFFITRNKGYSAMTLSSGETLTEKDHRVAVGGYWVLEAADYGKKVGIRARHQIDPKVYTLRRFKELMQ